MELVREEIRILVDVDGKPTVVQVDWVAWQRIVAALEDAEDIGIAQAALAELNAAGGNPERAGWLRLEDLEETWARA